jgi:hypothetical protein
LRETFMDAYRAGRASADDIHTWIENWHVDPGVQMTLRAYLGLSWREYRRWAEQGVLPR